MDLEFSDDGEDDDYDFLQRTWADRDEDFAEEIQVRCFCFCLLIASFANSDAKAILDENGDILSAHSRQGRKKLLKAVANGEIVDFEEFAPASAFIMYPFRPYANIDVIQNAAKTSEMTSQRSCKPSGTATARRRRRTSACARSPASRPPRTRSLPRKGGRKGVRLCSPPRASTPLSRPFPTVWST
jgi:hypothetical protein